MSVSTSQTQALTIANTVINLMSQTLALYNEINETVNTYNDIGALTMWGALATAPTLADGSLGTADVTATSGHVIDPRVYSNLTKAVSASDLGAAVAILENLQSYINGTGAPSQGGVRTSLSKLSG